MSKNKEIFSDKEKRDADNVKSTMKAVVLKKPCSAEELEISKIPVPEIKPRWVLIKIKAFGINRAEILTRNGHSPSVKLPRVIGIECVGIIENPSDSSFKKGEPVFSMMNGMGRDFDGSYAEYTLVPSEKIYRLDYDIFKNLDRQYENIFADTDKDEFSEWAKAAAYPELYYTAYGSLFKSLRLKSEEVLLIRGGTGSVALAAIQLAKAVNTTVIATTRNKSKESFLKEKGADIVIVEDDLFEENLKTYYPDGVDKVLELIGASTLKSSLKATVQGGIVCMTGCLGGWVVEQFEPLDDIISESYLTSFNSTFIKKETIEEMFQFISENHIEPYISMTFTLDEISKAHKYLESNKANGKVIVTVQ